MFVGLKKADNDDAFFTVSSNTPRGLFKMNGTLENPTFSSLYDGKVGLDFVIHNDVYYFSVSNEGVFISRSVDGSGSRVWDSSVDTNTNNFLFSYVTKIKVSGNEISFLGADSYVNKWQKEEFQEHQMMDKHSQSISILAQVFIPMETTLPNLQ